MRYLPLSILLCTVLVWAATTRARAQGDEAGAARARAELDAGAAVIDEAPPDAGPYRTAPKELLTGGPPIASGTPPPPDPVADPAGYAELTWWALRAGYIGPGLLFLVFGAGAWARHRRGYIVRRWPRLDDGRAWAVVTILTVAAGTLVPLAAANALTASAGWAALIASIGLYIAPALGAPAPPATPGSAAGLVG